jgi:LEA14-like dessication related protein
MKFRLLIILGVAIIAGGCLPKDAVELRDVKNVIMLPGTTPTLAGDAVFYNPNSSRMKLRQIKVDIYVDGKKSATVDNDLNIVARPRSEFTIPLKVQLQDQDLGLVQTLKNLFGGKKYEIKYQGYLKVNINGFPMRVPIDHTEEFKLGF